MGLCVLLFLSRNSIDELLSKENLFRLLFLIYMQMYTLYENIYIYIPIDILLVNSVDYFHTSNLHRHQKKKEKKYSKNAFLLPCCLDLLFIIL